VIEIAPIQCLCRRVRGALCAVPDNLRLSGNISSIMRHKDKLDTLD